MKLSEIYNIIEHREQMLKTYVKTGIFNEKDVKIIDSITNGDSYTKIVADVYKYLANLYNPEMVTRKEINSHDLKILNEFYENLLEYDKNVFPLSDLYANTKFGHPLDTLNRLNTRKRIIKKLKLLPSIFLRNLKTDIRKERNEYEFRALESNVNLILDSMKLIEQLSDEKKEKVFKKIFSNEFNTFDKVVERLQNTTIHYLSDESTVDDIIEKVDELGKDEAEVIYKKNNIIAVLVKSFYAMSQLGCFAQWCFVTSSHQWDTYTYRGYPIIVFNNNKSASSKKRAVVVLSDGSVYNMYNYYMENGDKYLQKIGVYDTLQHFINENNKQNFSLIETFHKIFKNNG